MALCHGVAILRYTRLSNGQPVVSGKTLTGFASTEEDFADNAAWSPNLMPCERHVMPWHRRGDKTQQVIDALGR